MWEKAGFQGMAAAWVGKRLIMIWSVVVDVLTLTLTRATRLYCEEALCGIHCQWAEGLAALNAKTEREREIAVLLVPGSK